MYQANGKLQSKEQYVVQYAPLVKRIAHHLAAKLPASVEVDDLIQAGLIGLLDAAGHYDQSQGAQFETYASQRIRGAMLDELREADWAPRSARKCMRTIEAAMHKLEQKLGRQPGEQELANELKVPLAELPAHAAGCAWPSIGVLRGFSGGRRATISSSATPPTSVPIR